MELAWVPCKCLPPSKYIKSLIASTQASAAEFAARKLPEKVPQKFTGGELMSQNRNEQSTKNQNDRPFLLQRPPLTKVSIRLAGKGGMFQHHKPAMKGGLTTAIPGM